MIIYSVPLYFLRRVLGSPPIEKPCHNLISHFFDGIAIPPVCFRPLICSPLMSSAMNNCYFLGLKHKRNSYCFLVMWTRGVDIRKKVWANTVTLLLWLNSGTLVRAIISVNWVPVPGGRTLLSRMSEKVTITYVTWRIRKLNERALLCQGNLIS